MEQIDEILKRYYQGETTIPEEQFLKKTYQEGKLSEEPVLAYHKTATTLPAGLMEKIQKELHAQRLKRRRRIWQAVGSVAALLVLILTIRGITSSTQITSLQLSDHTKRERLEEALRIVGNTLEEKSNPKEKILYEDNRLIIAIE